MHTSNTGKLSKADIVNSGLFFHNALRILKNPLDFLSQSVRNHGPIMKLNLAGRQYIMIQHPEYAKHVLADRSKIYHKTGYKVVRNFIGDALVTSNGAAWIKKRRIINPVFHQQMLEGMVEVINEEISSFLERIGKTEIDTINITDELRLLTMSIISRTMFHTSPAEMDRIVETLAELGNYSSKWMKSLIKIPIQWPTPANRRYRKNVRIFDEIIYSTISKRKTARAGPANTRYNDLLDVLLDHQDEETGSQMPDGTVRDELTAILIGGYESTSQTLSWALYELAKNKEMLSRVRAESDAVMGDQLPTYVTISKLLYTRQIIDETLRFYPTFWVLARKNIEDDNLNSFHVPAGSNVLVNLYGLHHHPTYWANPDIFDPDRFDFSLSKSRPSFVFIPFGVAPRLCIGQNFAIMEMLTVINRIARMFDLEISSGYVPKIEPDTTLRAAGGIQLTAKKLKHAGE